MVFVKVIAIIVLGLALLWGVGFAVFAFSALNRALQNPEETTDAIVVLTGGANRIEEGLALFAAGRASHLFITGVHEDVRMDDILALRTGTHPLPPCCITLGYKARSTTQNAQETREWLAETGYHSIRLVTGDYHMSRALMELRTALPEITIYTHPVAQKDLQENHVLLRNLLLSEYHKSLYRWVALFIAPHEAL